MRHLFSAMAVLAVLVLSGISLAATGYATSSQSGNISEAGFIIVVLILVALFGKLYYHGHPRKWNTVKTAAKIARTAGKTAKRKKKRSAASRRKRK